MKSVLRFALPVLGLTMILFAQKVQVTSDKMKAYESKKEIHFIGNAKVTKLKDWIHGSEIIVYFNENNETKKYVAEGNVTFELHQKNALYKGKADRVIYLPKKSEYILTGNAAINDMVNDRRVNGNEIVLDMTTGNANVKGDSTKPVKFIFDMEKKGE